MMERISKLGLGSRFCSGVRKSEKGWVRAWGRHSSEREHDSHLPSTLSRMKVTSANILQLVVQPSTYDQELVVRIPLDMVAGLNT